MSPITFQRERAPDLWADIGPLLEEHYRELAAFQDIPLAPDKAKYNAAEDAGQLRCYTARWAGRLIGYAVFFVAPNAHYATSQQAVQDVFYVSAPYRRGRLGMNLLRYTEQALAKNDVDAVYHHVKVAHPALGKMLEYMGYDLVEYVFVKRLKRSA